MCVVGIPDEYSGEVPLAFVVLETRATERAKGSPEEASKIKASLIKVHIIVLLINIMKILMLTFPDSTSPMRRSSTNG